jgi:vitamin B12 transporter
LDRNHVSHRLLAAVLLSTMAVNASAQQPGTGSAPNEAESAEVFALPTEEVRAFRVPVQLRETSQGVSIVTNREIEARNPATAVDVLQQVPGLQVDQVGGAGGVSSVYVRGSEANHVLILIDGVRVTDPTNTRGGGFDFSALDAASIERIEVIRGAGSAIYGADALGGIINIVTKRGKTGFRGSVAGSVGGQDYRQAQGSLSGGSNSFQYNVNASKLQDGKQSDGGDLDLTAFSGSLAFQPADKFDIRAYARRNERDSTAFPEFSGGILFAQNRTLETREVKEDIYGVDFAFDPSERIAFNAKLARFDHEENKNTPEIPFGPGAPFFQPQTKTNVDFKRDSLLLSGDFSLPGGIDLTLGYEHMREKGKNRGTRLLPGFVTQQPFDIEAPTDFDLTRKTDSPFVEVKAKPIESLVLLAGLRRDTVKDSGAKVDAFGGPAVNIDVKRTQTSPSAGARYTVAASRTTLKANYARGFKPPSFFALGDPNVGDPTLRPEKSTTVEVGVEQAFWGERASAGVSVFRSRYRDLIDFVDGALKNVNNVKSDGVETELRLKPLDNVTLLLNYTYTDLKNQDTGTRLRSRPKHRAGLSVNYDITQAWRLTVNASYVGKVFDQSIPIGDRDLDAYTLINVAASYKWKQLTATLAVDNATDEKYQQFIGFENAGIRGRLGLRFDF